MKPPRSVFAVLLAASFAYPAGAPYSLDSAISSIGALANGQVAMHSLPAGNYSLLFSVDDPAALGASATLDVELSDGSNTLLRKKLHAGDADLYAPFHLEQAGTPQLRLQARGLTGRFHVQVNRMPVSVSLKPGGNHSWQDAASMNLGQTIFASADEAEYMPSPGESRKQAATEPAGEDWYKFTFDGAKPQLAFFQIELMDRDDVPVDIALYRASSGKLTEYLEGQDPVSGPHEVQALASNKFTPRLLKDSGDYYVRVRANHPEYKLRTRVYPAPPYSDPEQAIRVASDYILGAGDSWFANTPRRGGAVNRVESLHQETTLCVACHASHFSQRGALMAAANGYPVHQRQQLQFLSERFYNNPRPFYGFEKDGAVWSRVISAPANVLGRMSLITSLYEKEISGEPRKPYHEAIGKYLDVYYASRTELPPDETNGNTPLVSAFEVAWYAWKNTHDPRLPDMMAAAPVKNVIDLGYQTLALADIDRAKYKDAIAKNVERMLSLQRPDGQWSARFETTQPAVEFETGHLLWALAAAGVPRDNPQVKKTIDFLMSRQQSFGGWMDPLQSFENFKTPFRETQFAMVALSTYFPRAGHKAGWNSPAIASLPAEPVALLNALDGIWDRPSASVVSQIEAAAKSNDVLIRQAAIEALGRLALPSSLPVVAPMLGDSSKLVQRTAAWAIREIYSRRPEVASAPLLKAFESPDARTRWGATRVFQHHFAELAKRPEFVAALEKCMSDKSVATQLQAVRGVWQAWFWNADPKVRDGIENAVLSMLGTPQHPWIETNVHAAVYNLADENIRYLYNNWVPLLGRPEDRERAIRGRLAIEAGLAAKFAKILENGPDARKRDLLAALTEFPLRRGDVYDLDANLSKSGALVISRIGNDIEQIAFFGASADRFAQALNPLLDSKDPEMRTLAQRAALLVRPVQLPGVNEVAGPRGAAVDAVSKKLSDAPDAADVLRAFRPPVQRGPGAARVAAKSALPKLDQEYFKANVDPILRAKGKDGYACADCHANHTLFNGTWTTVANVVNTTAPEESLLLQKPTSTSETEGITGSKKLAHGGGMRWAKDSAEYQTILKWIQGAKP